MTSQKKIYILTDLEGISGVYKIAQTGKALYEGDKKAMEVLPDCKPYKWIFR